MTAGDRSANGLTGDVMTSSNAIVLVPTYNEAQNVSTLAEQVLASYPGIELLIVDDASPDGTGAIVDELAAGDRHMHALHRTGKRGYASASRDGMRWCMERGYEYVVTMDGDLSHDPGSIPRLLDRASTGAGVVIGSRYVEGGECRADWSPARRAVSTLGSRYARMMIGTRAHDCTSGFRCYNRRALELLRFDELRSEGYCFLIEVLAQLTHAKAAVAEVPIVYIDRQHGQSKISNKIVREALLRTTVIGIRRLLGRAAS